MDFFALAAEYGFLQVGAFAVVVLLLIPFGNALIKTWRERKKIEHFERDRTITGLDDVATGYKNQLALERERHKHTEMERDSYQSLLEDARKEDARAVRELRKLEKLRDDLMQEIAMHKADKIRLEAEQRQANQYIGDQVEVWEKEIMDRDAKIKELELELAICRQVERAGEAVRLVTVEEELIDGSDAS